MLFWWLTLFTSIRPLCNMLTRLVLSVAFVSVARQEAAGGVSNREDAAAAAASARSRIGPIEGEFHFQTADNFENYLKELGVSFLLRNLAGLATPVVTITKECPPPVVSAELCSYTIRTDTLFKSHSLTFKLGQTGSDVTMDGRRVEYAFTKPAENKLLEIQTSGGKTTKLLRTFYHDRMEVAMEVNAVRASSVFERSV